MTLSIAVVRCEHEPRERVPWRGKFIQVHDTGNFNPACARSADALVSAYQDLRYGSCTIVEIPRGVKCDVVQRFKPVAAANLD
ncbi:MAG: hypothetical protein ABI311_12755 [Gemmatimonadaceae bacterium]